MPPRGEAVDHAWRVGLRSCATGVACLCKLTFADEGDYRRVAVSPALHAGDAFPRVWRGRVALPRDQRCTFIEMNKAQGRDEEIDVTCQPIF
jgi:hypothetical protein